MFLCMSGIVLNDLPAFCLNTLVQRCCHDLHFIRNISISSMALQLISGKNKSGGDIVELRVQTPHYLENRDRTELNG